MSEWSGPRLGSLTLLCFLLSLSSLSGCIRHNFTPQPKTEIAAPASVSQTPQPKVNINTAVQNDLQDLPGVGPVMATRIIEFREKFGAFRKPEHLLMVRGMSDKHYRRIAELISVD